MAADPVDPEVLAGQARNAPLTRPRPGHADLAGMQKYGHTDARPILERASARETAARVALGVVAKNLLRQALGIEIVSHVVELGTVAVKPGLLPASRGRRAHRRRPAALPRPRGVGADGRGGRRRQAGRRHARRHRRGARVRRAAGAGQPRAVGPQARRPPRRRALLDPGHQGRGDRRRLHPGPIARLGQAHDEIVPTATGVRRLTDRAGGLEGGITTGEPLRVRAAMKPISSLNRALSTVDVATGEPATAINQRSDVCAVPAAAVVAEAMVALVLAEAAVEKFGGDSVAEMRRNLAGYLENLVIR